MFEVLDSHDGKYLDLPRNWDDFHETTHPTTILREMLKVCNGGVEVVGAIEPSLIEVFQTEKKAGTGTFSCEMDLSIVHGWKCEIEWTEEELEGCIDLPIDVRDLAQTMPSRPVDTGESTAVPAFDKMSKVLDKSPVGSAVKAAADLASLQRMANVDPSPVLRFVERRWGLEENSLDSVVSTGTAILSIGRLAAAAGSRNAQCYGFDNLAGRVWLPPTGLNSDSFLTESERSEGLQAAVDFKRLAEAAKMVVYLNYSLGSRNRDHLSEGPMVKNFSVDPFFATKYKYSDFAIDLGGVKDMKSFVTSSKAIQEAARYLSSDVYIKQSLASYSIYAQEAELEGGYSLDSLTKVRRAIERTQVVKHDLKAIRALLSDDVKEVRKAASLFGRNTSVAIRLGKGVFKLFSEFLKDHPPIGSIQIANTHQLYERMKRSVPLTLKGEVKRPVEEINNREELSGYWSKAAPENSLAAFAELAKKAGTTVDKALSGACGSVDLGKRAKIFYGFMTVLPRVAYHVAFLHSNSQIWKVKEITLDVSAIDIVSLVKRAKKIMATWHAWYVGRAAALRGDEDAYGSMVEYQTFAHFLEGCRISEAGTDIIFPDLYDLIIRKAKKYARRKKSDYEFPPRSDYPGVDFSEIDENLRPEKSFADLYARMIVLRDMILKDVQHVVTKDENVLPHDSPGFEEHVGKVNLGPVGEVITYDTSKEVATDKNAFHLRASALAESLLQGVEEVKEKEANMSLEEKLYRMATELGVSRKHVDGYLAHVSGNTVRTVKESFNTPFALTHDIVASWYLGPYQSMADIWDVKGYDLSADVIDEEEDVLE